MLIRARDVRASGTCWAVKSPLKKRGLRFAKSFTAILRDPRISNAAKTLLAILKTYADKDGRCFPSVATLAACTNSHRNSVFLWLSELEKLRIIRREHEHRGGTFSSNTYWIDDEHFARHLAVPPCTKNRTRCVHKKQDTK